MESFVTRCPDENPARAWLTSLVGSFAAILLLVSGGCSSTSSRQGPTRHVILVSLDTTRPDLLGFYGNAEVRTPNLDDLASESIVLDEFMTVVPTTLASHASLFTGKYPHRHGTPRNGFMVHQANVTLAELLREQGFVTAGFAGSFALSGRFEIAQGFEHYDESFERMRGDDGALQNERSAAAVTDAVIGFLDRNGIPDHLFLFAHYFDPHAPYDPPAPYDAMYDPRGREGLPSWFELRKVCGHSISEKTDLDDRASKQYAGEISYMDHHLGRLFQTLRERGILDEALLVITSDHGENFWEHRACFDHGWTAYQTTMRAVGLLRLPGARHAGARIGQLTASVDILPTVLEYLRIPAPRDVDGKALDLANATAREADPVRFGQATKPRKEVETDPRWRNMTKARFVRRGAYKLIQTPYRGVEELYDLAEDPLERDNLLGDRDPQARKVAAELRPLLERWAASARPLPSELEPSRQQETIERLKALGYLGN
jgi:arylsulfatase A-like enzyme